jgi:hypothetical protein
MHANSRRYFRAAILALLLTTISGPAHPQDSENILINDDNSVSDQTSPRIAIANSADFIVVWTDKRSGESDIFFQSFDSAGTPAGNNHRINNDGLSVPQFDPAVDAGTTDRFSFVWQDYRNGTYPFNPDIYFCSRDTGQAPENYNITQTPEELTCKSPDVAALSDGTSIVVWSDYRNNNWDIYGQRVGASGQLIDTSFRINSDVGVYQQHSPRVAALGAGGFVVVWYDNRFGDDDIFARRFDPAYNAVGGDIPISDDNTGERQAFPAVAADGYGRFFIAWVDWRNGVYPSNPDIYIRRYDSSAVPVGASVKVNNDNSGRPQRDVSLCSDRMGNIGIIWADSSSGQWEVMAQIVDHNGVREGKNFPISEGTEGKQLQPDIATDGYKFYCVWADSRRGHFDIYAVIERYNDPTLIPDPDYLEFTMQVGTDLPDPQPVALRNAGYGELNWQAFPTTDWISVNPTNGLTPDTFEININTDTLPYGIYYGAVRMIDLDHDDSTESVSIRLDVTAPLLDISPDTLYFRVPAELGDPEARQFQINNAGSGQLSWAAEESTDWFTINTSAGIQSEYISVSPHISGLEYGHYFGSLIISSAQAINSPETAWVQLELTGNMPYIDVRPDTLELAGTAGQTLHGQLEIVNLGGGQLNWTAVPGDNWVIPDTYTGSDCDTLNITAETGSLASGYHHSEIVVYDSASFNEEVCVPVMLRLSSEDTVQFFNTNAVPGGLGVMPVYIRLADSAKGGYIPFGYDSATAVMDSIIPNSASMPSYVDFYFTLAEVGQAEIGFRINDSSYDNSAISEGYYHIASLFFSVSDTNAFNCIDTLVSDSSGPYILGISENKRLPAIVAGNLIIGNPTSITDFEPGLAPERIILSQSYPNPFNSSTNIEIYLPRTAIINIGIYNILGQKVYQLYSGSLSAGKHILTWQGVLQSSLPAPSGIYFCRMVAGESLEIKKMVLLK